jgi:hypothetical protein
MIAGRIRHTSLGGELSSPSWAGKRLQTLADQFGYLARRMLVSRVVSEAPNCGLATMFGFLASDLA